MGLKIGVIVVFVSLIGVVSWFQIEPKRNKMEFNSSINEVISSIKEMDSLLQKVPRTLMVNYFVDNEGYLHLSNQRVGKVLGAERNVSIRNDMFFEKFEAKEIDRFFYLIHFLKANGIDDCHRDQEINKFAFSYKSEGIYRTPSLRFLICVSSAADTTSNPFRKQFRILDRNAGVILAAPIQVVKK